jgi:NAD(P)H-flavin reductase/hemoglobin-like flavoprotein
MEALTTQDTSRTPGPRDAPDLRAAVGPEGAHGAAAEGAVAADELGTIENIDASSDWVRPPAEPTAPRRGRGRGRRRKEPGESVAKSAAAGSADAGSADAGRPAAAVDPVGAGAAEDTGVEARGPAGLTRPAGLIEPVPQGQVGLAGPDTAESQTPTGGSRRALGPGGAGSAAGPATATTAPLAWVPPMPTSPPTIPEPDAETTAPRRVSDTSSLPNPDPSPDEFWRSPGTWVASPPAAAPSGGRPQVPPPPASPPAFSPPFPPALPPVAPRPAASALVPVAAPVVPAAAGMPWRPVTPVPVAEPPTADDLVLVRRSLDVLAPVADQATAHFYALLFRRYPWMRNFFPAAMDVQRDRLFRTLLDAAHLLGEDPLAFAAQLGDLGRAHRKFGVLPEHYPPFGDCLVGALERYCGVRWEAAGERAWRRVYALISSVMLNAAAQDATVAPPWWQAEIVSCEHPVPDVAVLTLRPDQRYPYRAGQYAAVETPWWPRVWRRYSFAGAPCPDSGLLTFQVKAVPAGWVSNALVHRARPGDVIRLGPAGGEMVLDHQAERDLLCVGGGTGVAPLKAVVEEAAAYGRRAPVDLFYGARYSAQLYTLEELRVLEQRHSWLTVHPVVAEPRRADAGALSGLLPDVVTGMGPWQGRDAFVSGPPAMVRRMVRVLRAAGVEEQRVRHDLTDE